MIEYTLPRSHAPSGSRLAFLVAELTINMIRHSRPRAAMHLESWRYQRRLPTVATTADPARMAVLPPTIASTAPATCGAPLCAVADHDIADGVRGDQAQKDPGPRAVRDAHDEECSEQEQNALQVERRVHQISSRGVDHPAVSQLACADPEIADVVARVAVDGLKSRGGDRLEDQVPEGRYYPEGGSARDGHG